MTERQTISVGEAAKACGISRNLAYLLCRQNKFPGVLRLGQKRLVVSKSAIERFLQGGVTTDVTNKS